MARHHLDHGDDGPPQHPVYADQRFAGLWLSTRAKLLAALVVTMVIAIALYLFWLVGNIADSRAARERDTKALACLLVQDTPPGNELADKIRVRYGCPAYSNRRSQAPQPTPSASPTHTSSTTSRAHAGGAPPTSGLSSTLAGKQSPSGVTTSSRAHRPAATGSARSGAVRRSSSSAPHSSASTKPTKSTSPSTPPTSSPTPQPTGLCTVLVVSTLCGILGA